MRSIYPCRLNKGFGLLLPNTYQMLPDEGRRLQRPKYGQSTVIVIDRYESKPMGAVVKELDRITGLLQLI